MTTVEEKIFKAFREFATQVTSKFQTSVKGEPEEQLRNPLEQLIDAIGHSISRKVVIKGESLLPGRLGKPDYAIVADDLLCGYIELKEPGKGANPNKFKGHDLNQWQRFQTLPNLIYSDGNEWGLFRNGNREGQTVRLSGDITCDGQNAITEGDAKRIKSLLMDFLSWEPIVPQKAKDLAELLAPLCRKLREDVADAIGYPESPLVRMAADWREALFPNASNEQFADAYAQTITFALLLSRSEGGHIHDLNHSITTLAADHTLLSRALQLLSDPNIQQEISVSFNVLQRVIDRIPDSTLIDSEFQDPWLYFYEDFLAAYDPALRKNAGAYYTPVEVVHAQIRLIDSLLIEKLDKRLGFADQGVTTLDPAVGTGTYLLGVIEHALKRIASEEGMGAVPAQATELAKNLYGFENMVGPYSVAELRVSRALMDSQAKLPKNGPGIFLTDTLESPNATPPQMPMWYDPIAKEHERALTMKGQVPILVCLGNPPYDRHEAADAGDVKSRAQTGGWVRWGDEGNGNGAILDQFIQPVIESGSGGDLKNLYNLYVYFWRWALWKVFEHSSAIGSGVVSFISASSYLDGTAFSGFRQHIRRVCDEIWILDLGGEGRGTRKSENVFDIQTPVAIAIAVCYKKPKFQKPATVHYASIEGTRKEKLDALENLTGFKDIEWQVCPIEWQAPFRPAGQGRYFEWPLLTDLMPWQHSGVQFKRTWPIAPDKDTLKRRWKALINSNNKGIAFRETEARLVNRSYPSNPFTKKPSLPIDQINNQSPLPKIIPYAYRSFDRQWIFIDNRLTDRIRPILLKSYSDKQIFLASLLSEPLGKGTALTVSIYIPDLHYFCGRGSKDIVPLYTGASAKHFNIVPSFFEKIGFKVKPLDFAAYIYGVLAHPYFTERFFEELNSRELRVPITLDENLFKKTMSIGKRLIWIHTYGQRFTGHGRPKGTIPSGKTKCTIGVPDTPDAYPGTFHYDEDTKSLTVGKGEFKPVEPEIFHFEVSGLKVVQSWLGYRMKSGKGKKSSPLDDIHPERWTAQFTHELLELLWVLEATLAEYPKQAELLDEILKGPILTESELPPVPDYARQPYQETDMPLFDVV